MVKYFLTFIILILYFLKVDMLYAQMNHSTDINSSLYKANATVYNKIVFSRQESGSVWNLYIMDVNGSNQTKLLSSSVKDYDPHFRYDGQKIVFGRSSGNQPSTTEDICIMDADGTNVINLTNDLTQQCTEPKWSWNGNKIVFAVQVGIDDNDIYTMNPDGTSKAALITGSSNDVWPSFSPDGQYIVYERFVGPPQNQKSKICRYTISTGSVTEITDGSNLNEMPIYSPDGNYIIFKRGTTSTDIYRIQLSNMNLVNLTNGSSVNDAPMYSYEGTKIAWIVSSSGMNSADIWIMNSDGSGKTQLTNNNVADFNPTFSPSLPNAPSAPVAIQASLISQTSFTANWNSSNGASGYYLDVAIDNGFTSIVSGYNNKDVGNTTTYLVNTNLSANTQYYYRVRAYNLGGTSSNSNVISLATLPDRYFISGNTGMGNVTLNYIDGTIKTINSDGSGNYSFSIPFNWNGIVTPTKTGYTFSPTNRTYTNVLSDQTVQNYIATINTHSLTITAANGTVVKNPNQANYNYGTQVQLTATPNAGYTFTGWSGDASGTTNPLTITMDGNKSVTANFSINAYTLTITATNGTIVKNPNQASYNYGTQVQLTATPNAGYTFTGWNGDASGTINPLTITMDGNKSITANFSINAYTLTTTAANGTIVKNPNQANYNYGTQVQLTATPNAGYTFTGWSGDASGTTNPLTITMDGNKSVTANFSINAYTLTITATNGTIVKNPNQANYNYGTQVQLTATPNAGYTFTGWSGDASGTINPLTITVDGNKSVTANFSINAYTLTTTAANGTIVKNPNQASYNYGTQVQLTATPNAGYTFTGWNGDASGTTNPLTITIDENKSVTANFTILQYTVMTTSNPSNGGTTTGGGVYNYGISVTVSATAKNVTGSKFQFVNWTENGIEVAKNSIYTFIITANRNLVANFLDVTSVEKESTMHSDYLLLQNYPNPFNPSTKIKFSIPKEMMVRLSVYNLIGQEIEILVNQELSSGTYLTEFYADKLNGGIYFYRIQTGEFTQTKKMILVK